MHQQLQSLKTKLDSVFQTCNDNLQQQLTALESRVERKERQRDVTVRQQVEAQKSAIERKVDQLDSKMQERLDGLRSNFDTIVRHGETNMQQKLQAVESKRESDLHKIDERMQRELQTLKSKTETGLRTCDSNIQAQVHRLELNIQTRFQGRYQELESKIETVAHKERDWVLEQLNMMVFCPCDGEGSLRGIIWHLTQLCGGNVVDKGVIGIDGSPGQNARNAFDFENKSSYYYHVSELEQWLIIDFKEKRIVPTHYSVQSNAHHPNCHPKSWVLEGALEGDNWMELDKRETEGQLRDTTRAFTFTVATQRRCKRLRFRKTSGCHDGLCHNVSLTAIEFFGHISH
jgi:Skp family chaperone for outer membrane proteins